MPEERFNPSIGLSAVLTLKQKAASDGKGLGFNPSIGLSAVLTLSINTDDASMFLFQSLNRA